MAPSGSGLTDCTPEPGLTDGQQDQLIALFASDEHVQVQATCGM